VAASVISFRDMIDLIPGVSQADVDEVECWLEELEGSDGPAPTPADLDWLWGRIVELAGGSLDAELEREARLLLGEVAEFGDFLSESEVDDAGAVPVRLRVHLRSLGRHPRGVWEAELLACQFENAWGSYESWMEIEPEAAGREFAEHLDVLAAELAALAGSTRRVLVRRMVTSTSAVVAFHQGDVDGAVKACESYFALAAQTLRESGRSPSLQELVAVTFAGVHGYAARGDADGVAEVMRRVRRYAEPAGENLPPLLMEIWSSALLDLDPAFAQMLAEQGLRDVQEATGQRSDDAMQAAFSLFLAAVAANDVSASKQLLNEWAPVAVDAGSGLGASQWMAFLQSSDGGAPGAQP
jgi:hypothetical protein